MICWHIHTVQPRILWHDEKSEVYQLFEFWLLVANCMQLFPEGPEMEKGNEFTPADFYDPKIYTKSA